MRDLCSVLGISLEDVIAIGDNYNDLPMLAEVGHPWIMKNSALDQAGFGQSHEFLRAESVEEILKKLWKDPGRHRKPRQEGRAAAGRPGGAHG